MQVVLKMKYIVCRLKKLSNRMKGSMIKEKRKLNVSIKLYTCRSGWESRVLVKGWSE